MRKQIAPGRWKKRPGGYPKPCSESWRTVSQVDEPFSLASFTDLCRPAGRSSIKSRASCELFSLFSFPTWVLDSSWNS